MIKKHAICNVKSLFFIIYQLFIATSKIYNLAQSPTWQNTVLDHMRHFPKFITGPNASLGRMHRVVKCVTWTKNLNHRLNAKTTFSLVA